jgi:holo-[acyl-carrier protein] synthase
MEIYIGTDIVENKRIQQAYEKYKDKFLTRIYTQKEIEYCLNKKEYIQCLSARFAAKEATIKAYYQAFKEILTFKQIEILGHKNQPAEILLHNIEKPCNFKIKLSLSHEKKYSIATVIIYTA